MLPRFQTFGELARHVGRLDETLLTIDGHPWSGPEIERQARTIARGLIALGVGRGARVCAWLPNSAEFILVELAATMIGAIFVPIQPRYGSRELRNILTAADPALLVFARRSRQLDFEAVLREVLNGGVGSWPSLRSLIALGSGGDREWRPWQDLLTSGAGISERELDAAVAAVQPADPAMCIFTSGTTGMPKGALLAHGSILGTERSVAEILRLAPADRVLYGAPLASVFGCCNALMASWTAGARLVVPSVFDAGDVLATIERERCTVIYGVPTMFHMLLEHPAFDPSRTASLRTGIVGGAPCPPSLATAVRERLGVRDLTSGYGMSETCAIATMTRPGDPMERVTGSVGRPLPGVGVKITDGTGAEMPAESEGEICLRGSNLMLGYFNAKDGLAKPFDGDGWFRSGDAGALAADGNLRITGRVSDMILVGGFNVYPAEVESVLAEHESVVQAYVVGIPDERLGERPVAFVQPRMPDSGNVEEALIGHCAQQLARYKVPVRIFFVTDFPMTPLGKVQKFVLRQMAIAWLAQPAEAPSSAARHRPHRQDR